jgi:hypothetical protein
MDQEPTAAGKSGRWDSETIARAVTFVAGLGLFSALVAFMDGIVLMAKVTSGWCHQGGGGADLACTVHPRASEGIAISAISLSVAVLIAIVAYVSIAMLRQFEPR